MGKTAIGWTDFSVNPIRARNLETGDVGHFCEKVSPGCAHCYSSVWNVAQRHKRKDGAEAVTGTGLDFLPVNRSKVELFLHEETLREPLKRRKPTKWFWCDMTDLFGDWVDDDTIDRCFAVMAMTPRHVHQVLTKRPERAEAYLKTSGRREAIANQIAWVIPEGRWYKPILPHGPTPAAFYERINGGWRSPIKSLWLGTSVEDQPRADERIPHLLRCPAAVRFLSCAPLLGPVDLMNIEWATSIRTARGEAVYGSMSCLHGLVACDEHDRIAPVDWVIVGGESGPNARPMHPDWARSLRDQCQASGVRFFFKQWGEWKPISEMPEAEYEPLYEPASKSNPDAARRCRVATRGLQFDGREGFRQVDEHIAYQIFRVGKKRAGRLLDGREWSEFPTVAHATI